MKLYLIIAALALLLSGHCVQSAGQCDINKLASACQSFVLKNGPQKNPSPQCCQMVKQVDVPCVCSHLPKGFGNIISIPKVVYVAKYCGKPLPKGSICGSSAVPRT